MTDETYELENVELRAAANPDTFEIPPRNAREGLLPGTHVKLIFHGRHAELGERLWVKIQARNEKRAMYFGLLRDCATSFALEWDAPVRFGPEHIADIAERDMRP